MIVYKLCCKKDHEFEAWFRDSSAADEQLESAKVEPAQGEIDAADARVDLDLDRHALPQGEVPGTAGVARSADEVEPAERTAVGPWRSSMRPRLKWVLAVAGALIAIGLVLTSVFVPTAFIPGIPGIFYRQFAVAIATASVTTNASRITSVAATRDSPARSSQSATGSRK